MADHIDEQLAADEQASPFDANDPEAIEAEQKKLARLKEKKLRVVEAIMGNDDGRAWMYEFLGDCHVFSENLMRDTPERNGRFEGERAVGLRVLGEVMTAAPEKFWQMRMEALERERK